MMPLLSKIIWIFPLLFVGFLNPSFGSAVDERAVGTFPWSAEAAQVVGRTLAIRHVLGAGSAISSNVAIDDVQQGTAPVGIPLMDLSGIPSTLSLAGSLQAGIQPASAWAGRWSSLSVSSRVQTGLVTTALLGRMDLGASSRLSAYGDITSLTDVVANRLNDDGSQQGSGAPRGRFLVDIPGVTWKGADRPNNWGNLLQPNRMVIHVQHEGVSRGQWDKMTGATVVRLPQRWDEAIARDRLLPKLQEVYAKGMDVQVVVDKNITFARHLTIPKPREDEWGGNVADFVAANSPANYRGILAAHSRGTDSLGYVGQIGRFDQVIIASPRGDESLRWINTVTKLPEITILSGVTDAPNWRWTQRYSTLLENPNVRLVRLESTSDWATTHSRLQNLETLGDWTVFQGGRAERITGERMGNILTSRVPRGDERIILGPGSTAVPIIVNSPKPFKLPEPYGTGFVIGAPIVKLTNETGYLGGGFSYFAKGVSLTSAGLKGLSIGTDLGNVSRSNDPYHLWRLTGDSIALATGLPGGTLADVGNAMRTQMINQRNSMVIDKLAGPGALRDIFANSLDHPTRLSSQHLLSATTFGAYNNSFTRMERQMTFTQLRTETYGRFDYFHAGEPIRTTIVTRQLETIRTSQGWSSFGSPSRTLDLMQLGYRPTNSTWTNWQLQAPIQPTNAYRLQRTCISVPRQRGIGNTIISYPEMQCY